MEKEKGKYDEMKNGVSNGFIKELGVQWSEYLTELDLSNKNFTFDENVTFPPNLTHLNLSHNHLKVVPDSVLNMNKLKWLNLSYNQIKLFDDTPNFCHSIEELNLSNNNLAGPPYWVWVESPSKLAKINLSNNSNITSEFINGYFEELLQYKTLVTEAIVFNCRIRRDFVQLFGTFSAAKILELGSPDLSTFFNNNIEHVPCKGLDKCCDIERLNLSNTQIYSVEPNINIYRHLVEINLSHNKICSIPCKFCELENLEICILSFNSILYLPEDMIKLKNLSCLRLDSNELCMLPENLCYLPKLRILDLYNNSLYEVASEIMSIEEIDLAQNFMEEPDNEEYLEKRQRIRLKAPKRSNGRKEEPDYSEGGHSTDTTDDEEFLNYMNNPMQTEPSDTNQPPSSPEDWDSDEYWVPHYFHSNTSSQSPWIHFMRRKIQEGNFCPVDLHTVSITEQVKYEKQCNPKKWTIADGQFDDLSEEDS